MTQFSANALRAWARDARCGEEMTYFRGDLNLAKVGTKWNKTCRAPITERAQREITAYAGAAWELHEMGVVSLVQKRLDVHDYEYTMQRTRRLYREIAAPKPRLQMAKAA